MLEARTQLEDLLSYMDGKNGAQELLDQWLQDPEKLKALLASKAAERAADMGAADSNAPSAE